MSTRKILVTTSTFPRWENDTDPPFVYYLCSGLSDLEVHVLAPHTKGAKTDERMGNLHVHRFRYAPQGMEKLAYDGGLLRRIKANPLYALLLPAFLVSQWWSLRSIVKRHDIGLVHAHWIIPQGIVAVAAGIPFVVTSHGGDLFALKGRVLGALKRWVLNRASLITVVSTPMREECLRMGVDEGKIRVLPMGVDTTSLFTPPPADKPRSGLLYVGRLVEKKGVSVLINALAGVKRAGVDCRLTIVGDGPDRSELQQLAERLGVSELINWLGALSNKSLPAIYRSAEVFILPSIISRDGDQEGLGLVTVEAMACGCPVIASSLPAVKDVVEHGTNGLLVPPGDVDALADAICKLVRDGKFRNTLADSALSTASRFDWKTTCAKYEQMFIALL